jgi:hypothetical protein
MEATDYYFREIAGGQGKQSGRNELPFGVIKIKNASGAARRKGEILQVGSYIPSDLSRHLVWHSAMLHDGTDAPFGVLLEAIPDGDTGPAQILGICPALVTFGNADMTFARPDPDGTDVLMADVLGPVRILHKPSGTGEKECLVLLGDGRFEAWGYAVDNAAEGVDGSVMVWEGPAGGAETGIEVEAECLSPIGVIADGKVTLGLMGNVLFSLPIDECEG